MSYNISRPLLFFCVPGVKLNCAEFGADFFAGGADAEHPAPHQQWPIPRCCKSANTSYNYVLFSLWHFINSLTETLVAYAH